MVPGRSFAIWGAHICSVLDFLEIVLVTGLSHPKETAVDLYFPENPLRRWREQRRLCTPRCQGGGKRVMTVSRPFDSRARTISPDRGVMPVRAVMLT